MLGSRTIVPIAPLLTDMDSAAVVDLCIHFGRYRTYGELEPIEIPEGPGLVQRHDSVMNFVNTGGLHRAAESLRTLAARTSYFREEYAYGGEMIAPDIAPFLFSPRLADAARAVHGRPVVEPQIAYANLMVPGQELAVHTDVPEFRGVSRKTVPQWLLVVMHHSGLFDQYRMHIATGIAWFSDLVGGALAYWPDGPGGPLVHHPIHTNTALVLDTDSVFHGVDRVSPVAEDAMPPIRPGCGLRAEGDRWIVRGPDDAVLADYRWSELRLSVSWKAYCFAREADRDTWRAHADDLTLDVILETLRADLSERRGEQVERNEHLGLALIDEYIRFPVVTPA
ncbi:MAG: hypothetical protein ABIP21_12160 [Acidimicrobiia bacterium]